MAAETLQQDTFLGTYIDWRRKRLAFILHHYGIDFFKEKSLLELGCGFGHIGNFFHELGAKVTCCDAKELYLEELKRRHPHLTALQCDLDMDFPSGTYDICIHMGVLYHLEALEANLRKTLASASHVILETEVCDSDDPAYVVSRKEDPENPGAAFGGTGVRPSAAFIERILSDLGATYIRCDDSSLNSGDHLYDWIMENTGEANSGGMRRFWFIQSGKET